MQRSNTDCSRQTTAAKPDAQSDGCTQRRATQQHRTASEEAHLAIGVGVHQYDDDGAKEHAAHLREAARVRGGQGRLLRSFAHVVSGVERRVAAQDRERTAKGKRVSKIQTEQASEP